MKRKIFNIILKLLLILDKKGIVRLNDKLFLKIKYFIMTGEKLNLENPKSFNEKLQWIKLYNRNPKYSKMVDKSLVREYIKETIGEKYLVSILGVYDKFDDIDFEKFPNQFVIKCTHDSGSVVICHNKNKFDISGARKQINKSLRKNYYYHSREWPYKNVKPRIIVEKYMEDKVYKEIRDYKFFCFNGVPEFLHTCTERGSETGVKQTYFDLEWNRLPFKRKFNSSSKKIEKPINFELMLEFSRKLSNNIPFVRVDWYEVNGKLYFGELTFFPSSGFGAFEPKEWNYKLGEMINLSDVKVKNEK